MPNCPTVASDTFVGPRELLDRVTSIFERAGLSGADAEIVADSLVIADLRGVHSHGVLRVPEYVKKLTVDGVDPKARPFVASGRAAALVVDGANAMGQIACTFAMDRAIEKASSSGIAMAAVRGSNHCGALFHTSMRALAKDQIGVVGTNALPTMAPWGGVDKILGINPIAFAIPAGIEPPIVFDAAFSASSHGKIRIFHQKGLDIPDGWAFDADGNPTTKTAAALTGLLQPIGAFKGVGLAVIVGILSSMLSGAAYGLELGNMVDGPRPGHDGQCVIAIDVAAFVDPAEFKARVDAAIRQIRASRPAAGFDRCYAPGELEHETELRYRETGIPLNAETLAGLAGCE
ncbi:MAG: Ldh family oxidoreductase [Acidobacteria bacterium]|nr:Ldh family oxidoreductase [Acidobacteriota bacterium]